MIKSEIDDIRLCPEDCVSLKVDARCSKTAKCSTLICFLSFCATGTKNNVKVRFIKKENCYITNKEGI